MRMTTKLAGSGEDVTIRRADGRAAAKPCSHRLIPGLDASYCPQCQKYYVDAQIRERLLGKRNILS